MKKNIFSILLTLAVTMIACKDQGSNLPESPPQVYLPPITKIAPGLVAVKFVKSVTRSEADRFIRGLNLVPIDLSDLDRDLAHLGVVGVPVGQEKVWVDSLKKYPAIVVDADFIYVTHIS